MTVSRDRVWMAFTVALLLGCAACAKPGTPPGISPQTFLLVTLDTFRADHLGIAGHPSIRTPHLDRLARQGISWSEAVSAIPLTTPSHATILTGLSPRTHGVLRNRTVLDSSRTTVAEILRTAGARTHAVVSNGTVLSPLLQLDQGFDTYDVIRPAQMPASGEGSQTVARVLELLRDPAERGKSQFIWAHFFDAHLPYLPPPGFGSSPEDPRAAYAGEVAFLDQCIGKLVGEIEAGELMLPTTLLVTADHGEGLGEHAGVFGHDTQLYDTSLRIPLLLWKSGAVSPGADGFPSVTGSPHVAASPSLAVSPRLVEETARTMDLAPTILGLWGIDPSRRPKMEGRDLLRDPEPQGDALAFIAETYPDREKSPPLYALRTKEEKVIWNPRAGLHEMFQLARDPAERHDLASDPPELLRVLAEDLEIDLRTRPVGQAPTIDESRGTMDEETRAALESLGYSN